MAHQLPTLTQKLKRNPAMICRGEPGSMPRTRSTRTRRSVRFFTLKSATALFTQCGYVVVRAEGVREERFPFKLDLLNRCLLGGLDDMRFMQIAMVARPICDG